MKKLLSILAYIFVIFVFFNSNQAYAGNIAGYSVSKNGDTQNSYCQNRDPKSSSVADIAFCLQDGLLHVPDTMDIIAYVCGLFLAVKSILKLKEHTESKGQTKISVPILLAVASVLLISIPTALSNGIHSLGLSPPDQIPTQLTAPSGQKINY